MPCPRCNAYLAAERAAIEGAPVLPPHNWEPEGCACPRADDELVLWLSRPREYAEGARVEATWSELVELLAWPRRGAKDAHGGWSPVDYGGRGRCRANVVGVYALGFDIDIEGMRCDVGSVAKVLAGHRAIVHETHSSTADAPRCRAIVALAHPVTEQEHDRLHEVIRASLIQRGIGVAESVSDPSRLWYLPARAADAAYAFEAIDGATLDPRPVLAASKPRKRAPRRERPQATDHDRATEWAREQLRNATPGERHDTLCRMAHWLTGLGADPWELEREAVETMGRRRAREVERTIRDAARAARKAS